MHHVHGLVLAGDMWHATIEETSQSHSVWAWRAPGVTGKFLKIVWYRALACMLWVFNQYCKCVGKATPGWLVNEIMNDGSRNRFCGVFEYTSTCFMLWFYKRVVDVCLQELALLG